VPLAYREEEEALLLDKEREKEEHELYRIPERIVAHREAGKSFCKSTGLNYEHCT
jgi:chromodomain-helicase-DNA-binding protein 1